MSTFFVTKDPDATLDYTIDWGEWVLADDELVASSWTVTDGIVKDSDNLTGNEATVWLSGGMAGQYYNAVNHVTTNGGREDDRTLVVYVQQR